MKVRDIMTTNVVTVSSNASIIEARRIMEPHRFRRLPVESKGKLVGVVTADRLQKVDLPGTTYQSTSELTYSIGALYRTQVKHVMRSNVVTVTPEMTMEEALAIAQANKVGSVVVVEDDDKIVGIVTSNDFFSRIVNPVLGVGEPGQRLWVGTGGEGKALEEIISTINKLGISITTLHIIAAPKATKKDLVVHVDCEDVTELANKLEAKGYRVGLRKR
ncbi:CBS domain-containing protein [Chloroflexota bacterium]